MILLHHLSLLSFLFAIFGNVYTTDISIEKVERELDISSQTAKCNSKITFKNAGSSPVSHFIFAIEEEISKQLSYFEASEKQNEDSKLQFKETNFPGQSGLFYQVKFASPLAAGKTVTVNVETVFIHILEPFPAKIGQSEKQLVLFKGNTYFYTPYEVKEQTTSVKLSSSTIESYSRLKPTKASENMITYGPYKNAKPFKTHELKVHYENNSPFLVINGMTRWIEISHWGNVAVEETYHMTHEGAQLKGHFSRYDYQRTPTHAAVKSFKTVLPSAARDVYYRDEIGNISTSNMLVQHDSVEVELRPRFPLFGGWQTRYMLGYNVPAYQYLYNQGDAYILKMRFVDHVYDDFVIDHLTVKVVLPEGSTNIKVTTPYSLDGDDREIHKTYLDTSGRTVVVLNKKKVVESHIQDFQIHYTFKKIQLLQEPFLCVAAFYILFLSVIAIVRLDFSITKDAAKESRMKVASLIDNLMSSCSRRAALYAAFDSAIDKLKQTRDQTAFQVTLKKLTQDYSTLTQLINETCAMVIKEDPDSGDKLTEIQKKENERKVIEDQLVALATKVVTNKINRQQYVENESNAIAKRDKIGEELSSLLGSL